MIERVSSEKPSGAAVEDIEKELVNLWRQVGTRDQPMMRARVFTLIVVAPLEREAEIAECLSGLSSRHPARNIMVLLDSENREDALDADVTLLCSMKPFARCAEQIRLRVAGATIERVPAAARALLTANLSVVLWWTLPPDGEHPLFQQLAHLADRVVLDSSKLAGVEGLQALRSEVEGRGVSDLNWVRLSPWRVGIAQCFDAPAHREYLRKLERVRIECGANLTAGWLLTGWLAARLGWQVRKVSGMTLEFVGDAEQVVTVELVDGKSEECVSSVTMEAGEVRFEVKRVGEGCMESVADLLATPALEQVTLMPDESDPALLSRELDRAGRDQNYADALAAVQEMLEKRR